MSTTTGTGVDVGFGAKVGVGSGVEVGGGESEHRSTAKNMYSR